MNFATLWESLTQELGWYILFGAVMFLWVYAILWVARDISLRTRHVGMQVGSILLVFLFTPFIGLPIYLLIRPLSYYKDIHRQDALVAETVICIGCGHRNAKDNTYCTFCGDRLKITCKECKQAYACNYEYCPYCGAPNMDSYVSTKP